MVITSNRHSENWSTPSASEIQYRAAARERAREREEGKGGSRRKPLATIISACDCVHVSVTVWKIVFIYLQCVCASLCVSVCKGLLAHVCACLLLVSVCSYLLFATAKAKETFDYWARWSSWKAPIPPSSQGKNSQFSLIRCIILLSWRCTYFTFLARENWTACFSVTWAVDTDHIRNLESVSWAGFSSSIKKKQALFFFSIYITFLLILQCYSLSKWKNVNLKTTEIDFHFMCSSVHKSLEVRFDFWLKKKSGIATKMGHSIWAFHVLPLITLVPN